MASALKIGKHFFISIKTDFLNDDAKLTAAQSFPENWRLAAAWKGRKRVFPLERFFPK